MPSKPHQARSENLKRAPIPQQRRRRLPSKTSKRTRRMRRLRRLRMMPPRLLRTQKMNRSRKRMSLL